MTTSQSSAREEHGDGQSLLREFGDARMVETYMNTDTVDVKDRGIGTCMLKCNSCSYFVYSTL